MARLRAELDNVRAAVGWALDRDDLEDQELRLRILASLVEARTAPDMGLTALAAHAVPVTEASRPELRAPVLTLAAYHEWNQGRVEHARKLAQVAMRDVIIAPTVVPCGVLCCVDQRASWRVAWHPPLL